MKRPQLQTVVSVVEIVSALAVVVSLLYAGYEFRRSTTLNSREVENIMYQRMQEMDRLVIENPEFADIIASAAETPEQLSRAESIRFLAYEHIFYDSWESAWYYHDEGILEQDAWDSWNAWFVNEARRRPRIGWTGNRKNYAGGFLEYVDGVLPSAATPPGEPAQQ